MKKNNKKGFTLAELLIVVAIIAVLVAIAIPVFTSQLERSREATDLANVRSAYAQAVTDYLVNNGSTGVTVNAVQTQDGWQYVSGQIGTGITGADGSTYGSYSFDAVTSGNAYQVNIDDSGAVTISQA